MPEITANLGFLAKLDLYKTEKPYTVVPAADDERIQGANLSNVEMEWHQGVTIHDMRECKNELSLDTNGFLILDHDTQHPVLDEIAQCNAYEQETTNLLERHFQAERVISFNLRVSK